ncbi:MAG: hypothetical protein KKH61_21610, partial [Gammaproteobacteria bacterium]|nr:hypothetical protein [Gammaproteobacteria bacterium]
MDEKQLQAGRLLKVMHYLIDRYPGVNLPKQTILAYVTELMAIPVDLVQAAAERAVRTSRFFPTISTLLEAVADIHAVERGIRPADTEWEWVCRWIHTSGKGREGEGHEYAEMAVREIGGWDYLGAGTAAERHWRRQEFLAVYTALVERSKTAWITGSAEHALCEGSQPTYFERSGRMESLAGSRMLRELMEKGE